MNFLPGAQESETFHRQPNTHWMACGAAVCGDRVPAGAAPAAVRVEVNGDIGRKTLRPGNIVVRTLCEFQNLGAGHFGSN